MIRTAILAVLLLAGCRQAAPPLPDAEQPDLALLTSLPIVFAESFSLEPPDSPLLTILEKRFSVRPVDGPEQLKPGGLLLAVQPQALTAERLVALDKWVRQGGKLVLLADPSLTWESSRPLGDRFRPPYAFPDTGLLRHWGLTLESEGPPTTEAVPIDLGNGVSAQAASFGSFQASGTSCRLSERRTVARCRLGRGAVTVVADVDFVMRPVASANQDAVVALLDELRR